MNILFIYPNAEGYGRIPLGMSLVMTILSQRGHRIELFDTTFILKNEHTDNITREKAKLVLPTDISNLYEANSQETVDMMLVEKIKTFSPDLIAAGIVEDNYNLANHLLDVVKSTYKSVPVIVGGSTPTVAPEVVIKNRNIDYLIQGEGEESMLEFCDLMSEGKDVSKVRNLWYKKNGKIVNNPIRPFVDMNTLPAQNLDIWDKRHFVKPYNGKLYKAGFFEMSRGCLNKCTYCINGTCQKILREAGKYHRRKSVSNTIREISSLKAKFNFEMIFFCDDNFLLMSQDKVDEFADAWMSCVNIPYWINTTIETLTREKLNKLKKSGCCGIGIGVESGSVWLRENILRRCADNNRIIKAFEMIHGFDIRTTANSMIGFPGEYEDDIFETIKLMKKIKPKSFDLCFVAPYFGTLIHQVSKKMGYIKTLKKPGFEGMARDITVRRGPVIEIPGISQDRLKVLFYEFMDYMEGNLSIPERFTKPAPGCGDIRYPRKDMGNEIAEEMLLLMGNKQCGK